MDLDQFDNHRCNWEQDVEWLSPHLAGK